MNSDDDSLPPILFSSLSASILQDRRRAAAEAASTPPPQILVSALSASVLADKRAGEHLERAALERTVRERISGRQRHPASIQRPGVEDKDPATLMEPLVASSLQPSEEEDKVRLSGGDQESEAAPLRVWNLVRGDPEARRRLAQRLEAVSRVTEVKREKEVGEVEGSVLQGIRGFFQKIFTSL